MIPIGLGIVFLSYAAGIWGFCLIRGYNVPFMKLFSPQWPGGKTTAAKAPAKPVIV